VGPADWRIEGLDEFISLALAKDLRNLDQAADPVRRTYLPKPNGTVYLPYALERKYPNAEQE
jgi:hypothetical protein